MKHRQRKLKRQATKAPAKRKRKQRTVVQQPAGMFETTDASAAHAAAARDDCIETRHAVATDGSAAQEVEDTNERDKKIRALIDLTIRIDGKKKRQYNDVSMGRNSLPP